MVFMGKHGKKYIQAKGQLEQGKVYSLQEGLQRVKELAFANFDESVTADVNLGIDPTKGDQVVRGSVSLPNQVGSAKRVLVFAKGDYAEQARKAGADYVGDEDLIAQIQNGWFDFDYAIATPDMMSSVGKVAKILGPRGLLPNKKQGTVTFDVADMVKDLKAGLEFFKNDRNGLVHFRFGKCSLGTDALAENFTAFLKSLQSAKPSGAKGRYIEKVTITSTMGPGVKVNVDELL